METFIYTLLNIVLGLGFTMVCILQMNHGGVRGFILLYTIWFSIFTAVVIWAISGRSGFNAIKRNEVYESALQNPYLGLFYCIGSMICWQWLIFNLYPLFYA